MRTVVMMLVCPPAVAMRERPFTRLSVRAVCAYECLGQRRLSWERRTEPMTLPSGSVCEPSRLP